MLIHTSEKIFHLVFKPNTLQIGNKQSSCFLLWIYLNKLEIQERSALILEIMNKMIMICNFILENKPDVTQHEDYYEYLLGELENYVKYDLHR
jgi:hypothetical protein